MRQTLLSDLPVFMAVADLNSLTAAASRLGVTKSAISQSLRRLEDELGLRLFHRSTRGVHLTEAGAQFLALVEGPYQALGAARDEVQAVSGAPKGLLRVTAPSVVFDWLLLPALERLRTQAPDLRVELDLNDHFVDIVREGYDAGLRLVEAVSPDMIGRRVTGALDCALVAAPAYLATCPPLTVPEDVLAHPCLVWMIKGRPVSWDFGPPGQVTRLEITPALQFSTHHASIAAARAGLGLAYAVPRAQVADDIASGALVEVLPGLPTPLPPLMVYYSSRRHVPAKLGAFLAALNIAGGLIRA
ncbi:LysR family transcriptional regulator [Gemmobacter denitrificans]|uniref:LysR family transcriptional regulator n=1 Tax=Gemmobacter denitrificans TaxID=3123040 RepID=A0ABU8BRY6_9RHOB